MLRDLIGQSDAILEQSDFKTLDTNILAAALQNWSSRTCGVNTQLDNFSSAGKTLNVEGKIKYISSFYSLSSLND